MTANVSEPPFGASDPAHGWIWSVLPAGCDGAVVVSDPGLSSLLREAGLRVFTTPERSASVSVIVLPAPAAGNVARLAALAEALRAPGILCVPIGPAGPSPGAARGRVATRLLRLGRDVQARAATWRASRQVERAIRAAGLSVSRLRTGDRGRAHRVSWHRLGSPPWPGAVVIGRRGPQVPSTLDKAVAGAQAALGTPLRRGALRVRGSCVLLAELCDPPQRYMLRVAAGSAAALLERAAANVDALAGDRSPPGVRGRIPLPVGGGQAGCGRYVVEPRIPGVHPRRLTPRLWSECLDFLVELRRVPSRVTATACGDALLADLRLLGAYVGEADRQTLQRLGGSLPAHLAGVAPGWGHGDFWPGNLLVRGHELVGVLDWDAADPASLPLLDLLHLIALSDPTLRRVPHGSRVTEYLLPLARAGGDERILAYCRSADVPAEAPVLSALVMAYWVVRAARDLRTFGDRPRRADWMQANLLAPLASIGAQGA